MWICVQHASLFIFIYTRQVVNILSNFITGTNTFETCFIQMGRDSGLCSDAIIEGRPCLFVCVTGSMIDRITVFCSSAQELQEWLDNLQPFTKGGSPAGTIAKVIQHAHTLQTESDGKRETRSMLKCDIFGSKHL